MMGVPANYLFMAGQPGFADADLSSLRLAVVGGAPMPVSLLETWAARGVDIVQGYGLTEAAPNVLCLPPEDARRKAGSAGKPYPYVDCSLSANGELLVRGPNVFAGYWRNPEATAAAFRDGWLLPAMSPSATRTATTGSAGGSRSSSSRAARTSTRPRSRRCCTSTRRSSRPPSSACRTSAGARSASRSSCPARRSTSEELRAFCRARLARFKVPKTFHFVDELPRNAVGKVVKAELARRR